MSSSRSGRGRVRRVVVVAPSLFTLGNLFFGIWAIVLTTQGDYYRAGWYIVIAGVLDLLDGRIARISGGGTRFGAQLDSLVDLVSFGVAPALLLYFIALQGVGPYAWVFSYAFVGAVALRLARFNAHTDEPPGQYFTGLPSPAAGMTLALYYPFTLSALYQTQLATLPWQQILVFLALALSLLMVSNLRYAKMPRVGLRSTAGVIGLIVHLTILVFAFWSAESRNVFFFPLGVTYVGYGLLRVVLLGVLDRDSGHRDSEESEPKLRVVGAAQRFRRRRRRGPPPNSAAQ